jgi:hypothetical protein
MAISTLDHSWQVPAPADQVFAHLADPYNYLGLSPLIVAVRDVLPSIDPDGLPVVDYLAVERFRLLRVLRWDNPIMVRMTRSEPAGTITQHVVSPGNVRLTSTLRISAIGNAIGDGEEAQLDEHLSITMPGPLRGFVTRQARSVQLFRAAELARRFAG